MQVGKNDRFYSINCRTTKPFLLVLYDIYDKI